MLSSVLGACASSGWGTQCVAHAVIEQETQSEDALEAPVLPPLAHHAPACASHAALCVPHSSLLSSLHAPHASWPCFGWQRLAQLPGPGQQQHCWLLQPQPCSWSSWCRWVAGQSKQAGLCGGQFRKCALVQSSARPHSCVPSWSALAAAATHEHRCRENETRATATWHLGTGVLHGSRWARQAGAAGHSARPEP